MFCKQCGKKIEIGVTQCPHCKRPTDPLSGGSGYSHLSSDIHSEPLAAQAPVSPPAPQAPTSASPPKPVVEPTPAPQLRNSGKKSPHPLNLAITALSLILLIAVIVLSIKVSGLKTQVEILNEQIKILEASDSVSKETAAEEEPAEEATAPEENPAEEAAPPSEEVPGEPAETDKEPEDDNSGKLGNTSSQRTPYSGSVTGSLSETGDFTFTVDPMEGISGDEAEYQWYVLAVDAETRVIWDGENPAGSDDLVISISGGEPTVDLEEALSTFDRGTEAEIRILNDYFVAEGYRNDIAKYYFCRVTIGEDIFFTDLIQPLQALGTIKGSTSGTSSESCSIVYDGTPHKLVLELDSNYKALARNATLEYLWTIDGKPITGEPELPPDARITLEVLMDDGDEDTENPLIFAQTCTVDALFPAEG